MKSNDEIRNEEYLLLELCRLGFSDEHLKRISSLIIVIKDWNYFRDLTREHGVSALVWYNLEKYQLHTGMPENVAFYLKCTLMKSLSLNTFNTESTREVLRLLN